MKPMLTRIDEELATCTDPFRRAELLGERGCYLARVGEFGNCWEAIETLRSEFRATTIPAYLAWAMIAEGLLYYFNSLSSTALDRVYRSRECGRALGIESLRRAGSAWQAHLEFENSNFSNAARLIRNVDVDGDSIFDSASARATMVLGDVMLFVGDTVSSKYWYSLAHKAAVMLGDQAAIGALMYNRAAFGVALVRLNCSAYDRPPDVSLVNFAEMELASARSFERAIDASVLTHLVDLCEGRIHVLRGDFSRALAKFRQLLPVIEEIEKRHNKSHISGEIMYCELRLDHPDRALEMAIDLLQQDPVALDVDDRVVLARQLVWVFSSVGDQARAQMAKSMLAASIKDYEATIAQLRTEFSEFRLSKGT